MKFYHCHVCEEQKPGGTFIVIAYRNPNIKIPVKKANVCKDCQEQKLSKLLYQIVGERKHAEE